MKLFISFLFCFPMIVNAQTFSNGDEFIVDDSRVIEENPGDGNTTGLTSGSTPADSSLDNGQDLGDTGGFNVTQTGGLDGTNDGQAKGGGVQMMGLAMAAAFASQCGPHNAFACVAAGLSVADAMSGSSAKSAAFQTGTYLDPTHGTDPNAATNGLDPIVMAQIDDVRQGLADQGYTLAGDGSITGPDGTNYTADDLASGEAMQAKGATPEQAANFMKNLGNVKASAAQKAGVDLKEAEQRDIASAGSGGAGGGSGFGAAGASALGGDVIVEEIEYRGGKKKNDGLGKGAAARLSTNFNGDPIGIGMANLFLIVHQKYVEKKKLKTEFINREY